MVDITEKSANNRIIFHPAVETFECDFSGMRFMSATEVDAFYDKVDRRISATERRWYFLVNYTNCDIAPEAWDRFAERGKHTNIQYSLGTVRISAPAEIRQQIRERAKREHFRSNLFETREEALFAIAEIRKQYASAPQSSEDFFRVDDIWMLFVGIRALNGVDFSVHRGEVFSIIGPNGAGKTSMLNVISGFYRPTRGKIFFEGQDLTHLGPQAVARLGFARTFQNIALFK